MSDLVTLHRELGIPDDYAARRRLARQFEAAESDLVVIGHNDERRPIRLTPPAAEAWTRLRAAAAGAGIQLVPISGFRSVARQVEIIREKRAAGHGIDDILRYVAAPGFSEHHTGEALDIGSDEHIELDEAFEQTAAFRWLERHARDFGFQLSYPRGNVHGIGYEPWHWRWHG